MSNTVFTIICSSLGTALVISIGRDIKHLIDKKKKGSTKEHRYDIGNRVVVRGPGGRPVLCEIYELMREIKTGDPYYKVKSIDKGEVSIENISENIICCLESEFGVYNFYK